MTAGVDGWQTATDFDAWIRDIHESVGTGVAPELGTLNNIDAAARLRGVLSIQTGEAVGLALPLRPGPNVRGDDRPSFDMKIYSLGGAEGFELSEGFGIQSDHVELDCHGPVNTHVDALNHVGLFGTWFDGSSIKQITRAGSVLGLAQFGIFTRAIYLDIAAHRGTEYVEVDVEITGDDIDGALERIGVEFEPGDALILDCGRDRYEAFYGPWPETSPRSGSGPDVARWIVENRPGLILWDMLDGDNALGVTGPVHQLNWAIGLVMVDNCAFAAVREKLAAHPVGGLVLAPLPIEGATGCNVNPLVLL